MGQIFSIAGASVRLFGFFQTLEYDVIVVGGGGGGCPLAQTLVEGGKRVLILERGGEPPTALQNIKNAGDVLRTECVENFNSGGVVASTGNCLGGATSINQGIFIAPSLEWMNENLSLLNAGDISDAFDWIMDKVSPTPTAHPEGSSTEIYQEALQDSYAANGIPKVNVDPGQAEMADGVWRAHSTFENGSGNRRSADTILDRGNDLLTIRLNERVRSMIYDGDWWALPFAARFDTTGNDSPRVGMHLQDKPVDLSVYFFQPDFDYDQVTLSNTAATHTFTTDDNEEGVGLFEEITFGLPGQFFQFVQYERVSLPRRLRFHPIIALLTQSVDWCLQRTGPIPSFLNLLALCETINTFMDAGCSTRVANIAYIVSEPTSVGSVEVGPFGGLNVNVNYLDTVHDKKILSMASRKAAAVLEGVSGASALEGDGEGSCRQLRKDITTISLLSLPLNGILEFFGVPLDEGRGEESEDDLENGNRLANVNVGGHHYAGTAQFGKVVDDQFKVIGVSGLYVADASLMPKTPPVNAMASTMMLGRLAGVVGLRSMT